MPPVLSETRKAGAGLPLLSLALLLLLLFSATARVVTAGAIAAQPAASPPPPSVAFTDSQWDNTRRFLMAFAGPGSPLQGVWGGGDFCDWPFIACEQDGVRFYDVDLPALSYIETIALPEVPEDVNASEVMLVGVSSPRSCTRWTFSGTLPASWGRLTQLREIDLETGVLSGTLPPEWGHLHHLQNLILVGDCYRAGRGALSGTLPAEWASLASLQELNLGHNHLHGTLPAEWAALRSLAGLNLANNSLRGSLPVEWSSMSKLWQLDLKSNSLTGTLPAAYAQMKSLHFLDLRDNDFSGCVPASWRRGGLAVAVEAHLEAEGCPQGPVRGVSSPWTVRLAIGALSIALVLLLPRSDVECELRYEGSRDSGSAFDAVSASYLDSTDDDHELNALEETYRTDLPECV